MTTIKKQQKIGTPQISKQHNETIFSETPIKFLYQPLLKTQIT